MSTNTYIVLHDFTPVGDAALKYANYISSHVNCEIKVLNVVSNKSDVNAARKKLDTIISNCSKQDNSTIVPLIRVGNFFDDIGKIIHEEHAQLVIMGTHGMKGLQKIFGSHAMKVITSSDIPFIVLQANTEAKELKKIIVPVDTSKESLQIINNAGDISKFYNAKVYVAFENHTDPFLNKQIKNRVTLVLNKYADRGIDCEAVALGGTEAYYKKIINHSKENGIDLIAVSYHSESLLPQFEKFAQTLITNEANIPCMIINSKEVSFAYF